MPLPVIDPPLLNSANPWCTTRDDLQSLYSCNSTGAVTTRTCLLNGFSHDARIHQHTFFDPRDHSQVPKGTQDYAVYDDDKCGSLNTLGYSPYPLAYYTNAVCEIASLRWTSMYKKPFIISVTGSPQDVRRCYEHIKFVRMGLSISLCMEINLSCPNIPDKPPPAYSELSLMEYLTEISAAREAPPSDEEAIYVGIKTPPYTYADQFQTLIRSLLSAAHIIGKCPIDFITATNTLGSCLLLDSNSQPALSSASGAGVGGVAGAPLHPLALGNVKTLRSMLNEHVQLKDIEIIGVGGVSDKAGFERMKAVGAKVVGVGTALGRHGVDVFDHIL